MEDFAKAMIQLAKEIRERHTLEEVKLGRAYGVHACPICGGKVGYHVNVHNKHVAVFCEDSTCEVAGFMSLNKEEQHE